MDYCLTSRYIIDENTFNKIYGNECGMAQIRTMNYDCHYKKYGELGQEEWLMRGLQNLGLKSVILLKSVFIFIFLVSHFSCCDQLLQNHPKKRVSMIKLDE